MERILSILLALLITAVVDCHPWKPNHYVIIDTDGGIDDIRAITMFLASPDVRILGITTSGGALSPGNSYIKVKSLLNSMFHAGIPVGSDTGGSYGMKEMPFALQARWGSEDGISPKEAPDNLDIISSLLKAEKTKISFVCLGGMQTALKAFRNIPEFRTQVKDIVWSVNESGYRNGFNYRIDREAADAMLKQEIPVRMVRNMPSGQNDFWNDGLIRDLAGIKNPYAAKLSTFFANEDFRSHRFSFSGSDEMAAVFIHYPSLFVNKITGSISESTPADIEGIREGTLKIISMKTIEENQVIKELPLDPAFYFDDLSPVVEEIIEKHGVEEWKSGIFASEMHRHLGIFEIIGVKMGIRAREYFNTGVDEFRAVSYAGSVQPMSCMNDGFLVSTGSTPGHGLLTVRNDTALIPMVDFIYLGRKYRIKLKSEITTKISSELKEINFIYGLDSNIYWELVRKNTIKYWRDMDRHDIFEIGELN
ncbi:MAG TPA: nucleoside hydrolase [Bacteroidales bacterium]|jgi:pyrimidine-specific ribonucleoside hydrolase|nr:nucleoside hydrolase [Bacteroidales bacterium]HQH25429.1 nucleoside hydrolase [Bacteroidales bacterium]HQJ82984.1 nucleoside hydrolase [Bacteroidales bacterium]